MGRRTRPWWVTEIAVPLGIVVLMVLGYGLLAGLLDGPLS